MYVDEQSPVSTHTNKPMPLAHSEHIFLSFFFFVVLFDFLSAEAKGHPHVPCEPCDTEVNGGAAETGLSR